MQLGQALLQDFRVAEAIVTLKKAVTAVTASAGESFAQAGHHALGLAYAAQR